MSSYTGYNTIFDYLTYNDIPDGIHSMTLSNGEVIDFEIVNYLNDTIFSTNPVLGDAVTDTKMLILRFKKNLTINAGITLTPQVRKKGMCVYVEGTLTNNGTISMTAKGAVAAGQNVLLYKNSKQTYETIPAIGGVGATYVGCSGSNYSPGVAGNRGADGTGRQLGGGGSGAVSSWRSTNAGTAYSGSGATATSYSGGPAGGGLRVDISSNSGQWGPITGGAVNGGSGGQGYAYQGNTGALSAGGGAGNPGGVGLYSPSGGSQSVNASYSGTAGTGGLLILFVSSLINNGSILSNGSIGGSGLVCGGSSGGGSINIFGVTITNTGTINANGGISNTSGCAGGAGGNGTTNNTKFSNLFYAKKDTNINTIDVNGSIININSSTSILPYGMMGPLKIKNMSPPYKVIKVKTN